MIERAALLLAHLRQSETWAGDWRAGWVSAAVMLPQTVVLATLAGMPPEAGVYTSIFPVIVVALVGASSRLLSGPNTAVAVMLAAALTPLATPASPEYIFLALTLTAMVGITQLVAAGARLGKLFDAMPDEIIHGVTLGVGAVIIATQLPIALGVLSVPGEAPWVSLWHAAAGVTRLNPFALTVAGCSIICGALAMWLRASRGMFLLVALAAGTALAVLGDAIWGSGSTNLERVGYLGLELLALSVPQFSWDQFYILKQLAASAIAIAAIGALQTSIIARAAASGTPHVNPNRDLFAQGLGNLTASFTSGFAGSGSFNRSAAHIAAGARTRWAAILSAVILLGLLLAAGGFLAQVPAAAMAGALILIGWGLIRATPLAQQMRQAGARSLGATVAVAVLVVGAGLESAVFWGCAGGVAMLIWRHARDRRARMVDVLVELPAEKLKAVRRVPTLVRHEPALPAQADAPLPRAAMGQQSDAPKRPPKNTRTKT